MSAIDKVNEVWRLKNEIGWTKLQTVRRINQWVAPIIKGYVSTHVISAAAHVGLFEKIEETWTSLDELSALNLNRQTLEPVMDYLFAIRVVDKKDDKFRLSKYGKFVGLLPHGFFSLYTSYDPVFANLEKLLNGTMKYDVDVFRNEPLMALGSSQIIQWLPIPCVVNWMKKYKVSSIVDIGCGAGDFLSTLQREVRLTKIVGTDRSQSILEVARKRNPGVSESRIEYYIADLSKSQDLRRIAEVIQPEAITIMFVLHEIAFLGDSAVIEVLSNLRTNFPKSRLFICETKRMTDKERQQRGLKGNELQLFHALSNQKLLTAEEWARVFKNGGYTIREKKQFGLMGQLYFALEPIR